MWKISYKTGVFEKSRKRVDFFSVIVNNRDAVAQLWRKKMQGFNGGYMEEKNSMTIADVAKALGVSKTTVSRAISGKGRIGKETRERVQAYIEEHDYKPNVIARGLAQSRTFNICAVMHSDYEVGDLRFFQDCLFGIQEIASLVGYDILISICKGNDISTLERIITNRKVDGVILMRTFVEDPRIDFLMQKEVPFVTIGSTKQEGVIQVDHNHRSACKELTSILLMKGLTRIALIGGDINHVVTRKRYQGFREAYEQMGIELDENLLFLNVENNVLVDKAVKRAMTESVDCILCMDDVVCGRVLKTLREERISVPDDVRVASFYNSAILENNVPAVTSLSFDAKELGMVSCKTVLDLVDGVEVGERTLLPYEVILKASTK